MAAFAANTSSKDLCSKMQVTVRVKPCPANKKSILSRVAEHPRMIRMNKELFTLDYIKWEKESQERVYKVAAYPFVEKTLRGYSATILAFGQTGTGKSYTMGTLKSTMNSWWNSGLIQRCLKHIFEENKIQVSTSFVEIYKEELRDLLNNRTRVTVRQGVPMNAKIEKIRSLKEGFELVKKALELRQEHPTLSKESSSSQNMSTPHSHALLTFHLKIEDGEKFLESKLTLVDLAGVFGERCFINESLWALNNVITAMSDKNDSIQMLCENSILVSILKDSLDAKCLVSLVACVSSDPADYKENLQTLRFAECAKLVEIHPQIGVTSVNSNEQLKSMTRQLPVVLSAQPRKTTIVDRQYQDPKITPSIKHKIKNCTVVLKKSDLTFHIKKKDQECKENIKPLNHHGISIPNHKIPLNNIESAYSSGTNSTLSISELKTPNNDNRIFLATDLCSSQYRKYLKYNEYDSLASSSEDMTVEKPADFPIINNEILETECECSFHGFEFPDELDVPIQQQSTDQTLVKKQSVLANSVSRLSIYSGEETINFKCEDEKQSVCSKLQNAVSNDEMYYKELEILPATVGVNKLKRMNAILTTDFAKPGPSQMSYHSEKKMIKLDKKNPRLMLNRVCDLGKSETKCLENDLRDNIENQQTELNYKQKVHNDNILKILNSTTAVQLTALPRIGMKTAITIYQYRLIHGDFKSFKDLENLPIWSKKLCNKFLTANNIILESE